MAGEMREGSSAPMDIAAIDFETATSKRSSACAVGIAIPQSDGEIWSKSWLIRPPNNEYDGFNIGIHGIHPRDTEASPTFAELWPEISGLVGDRVLAAHNASFDISVLRQSLAFDGGALGHDHKYLCTYRLAQAVWPDRFTYRLADIARDLGLDTGDHHDPLWDAWAATQVAAALARTCGVEGLSDVAESQGFRFGNLRSDVGDWDAFGELVRTSGVKGWKAGDVTAAGDVDEGHPLFGQCVVITGTLPNGMIRREAYQEIVNVGGLVADNVTRKVNILVVADLDPIVVGDDGRSGKLRKAISMAEAGGSIELMDARDFVQLIGY
jgi:DNA polymerase III subunit epsilon